MSPERWHRITELFERALREPPDRRHELLARECHGNEDLRRLLLSLIFHHQQDGDEPSIAAPEVSNVDIHEQLADGRFRLLDRLGRGGFGTVYKAFDRDLNTIVALNAMNAR